MSTRNFMATHNLIAVSANNQETAINAEQTLDTAMLCAIGNVPNLEPRRESNAEEAIGKEEPDAVYDLGSVAAMPMEFPMGQPQHFAFLLAYALGAISTAAAGTGYEHTIPSWTKSGQCLSFSFSLSLVPFIFTPDSPSAPSLPRAHRR